MCEKKKSPGAATPREIILEAPPSVYSEEQIELLITEFENLQLKIQLHSSKSGLQSRRSSNTSAPKLQAGVIKLADCFAGIRVLAANLVKRLLKSCK